MSNNRKFLIGEKDSSRAYLDTLHAYRNKYYNLFRSNFKWTGLNYRQEEYIMREFWSKGSVACFKIKNLDELGFAPWGRQTWDMYNLPEEVILINQYGSPLIPTDVMIVDKNVVLGYIQSNKKPMALLVDWYLERISQVEMVIRTNLEIHKMPFIIPVEEENKNKIQDVVSRILNNELVLFIEDENPELFKAVATSAPYIIDKLCNYKKDLENELKTILGINNTGVNKIQQLQLAEVNANNDEILDSEADYINNLKLFCENIKKVFGIEISVESTSAGRPVKVEGNIHIADKKLGRDEKEEIE